MNWLLPCEWPQSETTRSTGSASCCPPPGTLQTPQEDRGRTISAQASVASGSWSPGGTVLGPLTARFDQRVQSDGPASSGNGSRQAFCARDGRDDPNDGRGLPRFEPGVRRAPRRQKRFLRQPPMRWGGPARARLRKLARWLCTGLFCPGRPRRPRAPGSSWRRFQPRGDQGSARQRRSWRQHRG